jgi:hypothetical protein
MAETAARLVDETLPEAPVRQWVLTVPHALRFLMAYDREWIAAVHHVFLNVHFHALALDGVYSENEDGALLFHPAGPPSGDEVARVVERVARRVKGLLARRAEAGAFDAEPDEEDLLPALYHLHAGTALPAYDREGIEHLLRYMCRPPVALERLEELPDGRLLYRLKKRWRDGTDSVVFEPPDFLERLSALIPAPCFNMIR